MLRTSPNGSGTTRSTSRASERTMASSPKRHGHEILDLLARPRGTFRPQELAAHLARRQPEAALRRGDHRRRRPWPGDRLAPRQRIRHQQRRGAGEGLDRLRQCRPQHHDHPLQLPAARQYRLLRAVDEAVGDGWSRTSTTTPWSASAACSTSTTPTRSATPMRGAATPCASTASTPSCSTSTAVRKMMPFLNFDNARFPDPGRAAAAARRHGAA